jgi:prevent-host-death family protein
MGTCHCYYGACILAIMASKVRVEKRVKSVNIAELKNRLSLYLNEVRSGEEILVRDRNLPIARIVPLAHGSAQDDELLALAGQGKIRLGEGLIDDSFWELPAPRVSPAALRRALEEERDED